MKNNILNMQQENYHKMHLFVGVQIGIMTILSQGCRRCLLSL